MIKRKKKKVRKGGKTQEARVIEKMFFTFYKETSRISDQDNF
jgi:hypothetical protein